MKLFKIFFFASLMIAGTTSYSQTIDEIIAKNINSLGGRDKLLTLKTVKMAGAMSVQGADVTIINTKSHLTGSRMDVEVMGTSNYSIATPTKGWTFFPVFGMSAPKEMTPDELRSAVALLDIQSPLLDYKEKGNIIELKGTEKVDGADAWNLKITFKNGKVMTFYLDVATARLVKTSTTEIVNGQEVTAEITFADYKQNAGGYWFAYSITNERGTIVYDNIETNVTVDESIFKN